MNIYVTLLGFICILIFIFLIKKYYYIEKYNEYPKVNGRRIGCKTTHGGGQHTHGDCGVHHCQIGKKYAVTDDGFGTCSPCGPGQSSKGGQSTGCYDCSIGEYEENGICKNCTGRYYTNEPKQSECTWCPSTSYLHENKWCTTKVVHGWQNNNFKLTCLFGDNRVSGVGSLDNKLICTSSDSYVWDYDGSYPSNKNDIGSAYSTIRRAGQDDDCWEKTDDDFIKNQEPCGGGRDTGTDNDKRFTILCDNVNKWSGGYNECVIRNMNDTNKCLKNNSAYLKPNGNINGNDCQRFALNWGGADKAKSSPIRCCH